MEFTRKFVIFDKKPTYDVCGFPGQHAINISVNIYFETRSAFVKRYKNCQINEVFEVILPYFLHDWSCTSDCETAVEIAFET